MGWKHPPIFRASLLNTNKDGKRVYKKGVVHQVKRSISGMQVTISSQKDPTPGVTKLKPARVSIMSRLGPEFIPFDAEYQIPEAHLEARKALLLPDEA